MWKKCLSHTINTPFTHHSNTIHTPFKHHSWKQTLEATTCSSGAIRGFTALLKETLTHSRGKPAIKMGYFSVPMRFLHRTKVWSKQSATTSPEIQKWALRAQNQSKSESIWKSCHHGSLGSKWPSVSSKGSDPWRAQPPKMATTDYHTNPNKLTCVGPKHGLLGLQMKPMNILYKSTI